MPELSVVVVSYRTPDLLAACLTSIEGAGAPAGVEVVVVDNASGDGTVERLGPRFPRARWIVNPDNRGFAPAVNQGVAATGGRLVLLLNPDAALLPGALGPLVGWLDAHPRAGAVGPKLLLPDGRRYLSVTPFPDAASVLLHETRLGRLGLARRRLRPYAERLDGDEPFRVECAEGSCLLVRRAAWDDVGGLDERYFFGLEEADLAWRLRARGWQVWFHPQPAAIHRHAGSTGGVRRGRLVTLAVTLAVLHFLRERRPAAARALRLPLLALFGAKWAAARATRRRDQAHAFGEAVRALLGRRPPWITAEDRRLAA